MSWLLLAVGVVGGLVWLTEVLGAAWYDIAAVRAEQDQRRHPYARRYRARPLVSVIVVTNGAAVEDCLNSVWASSYRKIEVIVVANGGSSAGLRSQLKGRGRLVVKRQPMERAAAIRSARRYIHGELVLLLEPSVRVERQTISQAVNQFSRQPDTSWLLPTITVRADSVSSLFQNYVGLLTQRRNKLRNQLNLPLNFDGPALFCRASKLARPGQGAYAAGVQLTVAGAASLIEWLRQQYRIEMSRWQRLGDRRPWFANLDDALMIAAAAVLPLLVGYGLYLAVRLQQPWLLGLGLMAAVVVIISAAWDAQRFSLKQKLGYIVGLPIVLGFGMLALVAGAVQQLMLLTRPARQEI